MRFRNTVVLGLIFAALLGYLYFVEAPQKAREESEKKLYALDADKVSDIHLQYADREILLKKTGSGWRLVKPVEDQADPTAVKNLLHTIGNAELKRNIEVDGGSVEGYGLDKPDVVVTLTLDDGKKLPNLQVGKQAPVGFSAFARIDGDARVKLTDSILRTGLEKQPKDLRDKTIVDFKDDDVRRIVIERADHAIELSREGEGEDAGWKIDKPQALAADAAEVRSFLSAVRGLRAEDFVDNATSLGDYGLESPRETVTLTVGKDEAKKQLLVGAQKAKGSKDALYVKRGEGATVYAVGAWAWSGLDKDVSALRDKTVLAFDRAKLGTIEVTRADGDSYRIVRKPVAAASPTPAAREDATWVVEGAPATRDVTVTQLVGDLHALKGYEIAAENPSDLSPYGLASPEATFSLLDTAGQPIGRVMIGTVGTGNDQEHYAMADGGGLVFKVREYLYSHLDQKKSDLVEEPPPTPAATPSGEAK